MACTICACGNVSHDATTCHRCGADLTDAEPIPQIGPSFDDWFAHMRDEIGWTTDDDAEATGAAW